MCGMSCDRKLHQFDDAKLERYIGYQEISILAFDIDWLLILIETKCNKSLSTVITDRWANAAQLDGTDG